MSDPAPDSSASLQYGNIINRLLDIFGGDATFGPKISQFRFGEKPDPETGNVFPLCYVTTATRSFSTNDRYGISNSGTDIQSTAHFEISLVVNDVSADTGGDSEAVKKQLVELVDDVIRILCGNPRLHALPDDDNPNPHDPLCIRSLVSSVSEDGKFRGHDISRWESTSNYAF